MQLEALESREMLSGTAGGAIAAEDFEDGTADDFTENDSNLWSVQNVGGNKVYQSGGAGTLELATSVIETEDELPNAFSVSADMKAVSGSGRWHDGFIIFDYVSDSDFKYAGAFVGQNQWVIGHYEGDFSNRLAQVDLDDVGKTIDVNTVYNLTVFIQGQTATLFVDGDEVLDAKFTGEGTLKKGQVGVMSFNAQTQFDNICVTEADAPLFKETFQDGIADDFTPNNAALWTVEEIEGNKVYKSNSKAKGLATSVIDLGDELPKSFQIAVDMTSILGPAPWHDGFIIFDYVSDTDFKYAGAFVGQNQWVIGHYQGDFSERLAQIDLDDEGKTIPRNVVQYLDLVVDGGDVTLFVNGEEVVSAEFEENKLNGGQVGLMTFNAVTLFDNFCVLTKGEGGGDDDKDKDKLLAFEEDLFELV
ncbi:LamG domain-containing protein [Polystyrenella longa]|nr:LamG domain-containing protein [Polystyrenella longa]